MCLAGAARKHLHSKHMAYLYMKFRGYIKYRSVWNGGNSGNTQGASRGFHVITGHTADNLPPEIEEIRWKSYAKLDETFVFLMGLKSIDMITEKLMRYGKLSDTPVAVIHGENTDGTYVKLVGTLSDIAAKVKEVDFPSPAIIVVGEVASLELTD